MSFEVAIVKNHFGYTRLFRENGTYRVLGSNDTHVQLLHRSGVIGHLRLSDVEIVRIVNKSRSMKLFLMKNKTQGILNTACGLWILVGLMIGFVIPTGIGSLLLTTYFATVLLAVLFLFAYNVWVSVMLYRESLKSNP